MIVCELIEHLKKVDPLCQVYCSLKFEQRKVKFEVKTEIFGLYQEGDYHEKCCLIYVSSEKDKES